MPQKSSVFAVQRTNLQAAGQDYAIASPCPATSVVIGNGTPDDLRVYSTLADDATYFVVAAGTKESLPPKNGPVGIAFKPGETAFWLRATQAGLVVLTWY